MKTAHRADRSGKIPMIRLCSGCGSVQVFATCDNCGLKLDGNAVANVRQGSIRHIRALLDEARAAGELTEDGRARIIAGMLGLEG